MRGVATRKMSQERVEMFRKLRNEGRTYEEIGKRFDISPSTVRMAVKKVNDESSNK